MSSFSSPDSYDSVDGRPSQYARYPSQGEPKASAQSPYSAEISTSQQHNVNVISYSKFDQSAVSNAIAFGSRFNVAAESSTSDHKTISPKTERVSSPFADLSSSKAGLDRCTEESALLKRGRSPPSTADATAGSRSYRQQTSELINRLDKLLKFATKPGTVAAAGVKGARGAGSKGRSRRPPRDLAKPRARNVVLKQAAELIWRIKCDEQVIHFSK